ncbi:hypothetical protein ACWIUD_06650 [Helicobacter sp. 23-1044]
MELFDKIFGASKDSAQDSKQNLAKDSSHDSRDYGRFKKALNDFKAFYGLDCGLKELDRYLWKAGKAHFAKYKK